MNIKGLYDAWPGESEEKNQAGAQKLGEKLNDPSIESETESLEKSFGYESLGAHTEAEEAFKIFEAKNKNSLEATNKAFDRKGAEYTRDSAELEAAVAEQRKLWAKFSELQAVVAKTENQHSVIDSARDIVERLAALERRKEKLGPKVAVQKRDLEILRSRQQQEENRMDPSDLN